jgi:hypothetical protein
MPVLEYPFVQAIGKEVFGTVPEGVVIAPGTSISHAPQSCGHVEQDSPAVC